MKVSGVTLGLVLGALLLSTAAAQDDSEQAQRSPRRDDIIATFSSGSLTISVDGRVAMPRITSGRLSLSTDDVGCAATPGDPCVYTLNELRLTAEDFEIAGIDLSNVGVVNPLHAPALVDFGEGIQVRPVIPFWIDGLWDGEPFGLFVESTGEDDYLEIVELVVTPGVSRATIFGRLTGRIDEVAVQVAFMTTADEPFVNRPPFADAGPPITTSTACIASVTPDASGTFDAEGDLRTSFYTVANRSIGMAGESIDFPVGNHDLKLVAIDGFNGRGFDRTSVTVQDNGHSEPLPGAEVVTITVPLGTRLEDHALVATESLRLGPHSRVRADSGPTSVVSLGSLTMDPRAEADEAWSEGDALLGVEARITGLLHANGEVETRRGASIGGVAEDGPFTPGNVLSFHAILPETHGGDLLVSPGSEREAAPGEFDRIRLGPRAQLSLTPGVYLARELELLPNSTLTVSGGDEPTIIVVTESARYMGHVRSSDADPPSLLVVYLGSDEFRVGSAFDGWIVAPHSDLVFTASAGVPEGATHRGAFVARSIHLHQGLVLEHRPLSWDFVRDGRAACAVQPLATCVRENPDGSIAGVFGYQSMLSRFGVVVPLGPFNRVRSDGIEPGTRWVRGQPQGFLPRTYSEFFEVPMVDQASWTLGGRRVVLTREAPRCAP